MKTLLVTGIDKLKDSEIKLFRELGFQVKHVLNEDSQIITKHFEVEYIVCNNLFSYHEIGNFKNLKYVHTISSGTNQLPMEFIKLNDIQVDNAKGVYSIPIAEWVVLKILEIHKKSHFFYENQKRRKWEKNRNLSELTNKNVLIIGYGDIGIEIAKRIKAFGVKITGVNRTARSHYLLDKSIGFEDLDQELSNSEIIILTVPLTSETTHLLNGKRLKRLKKEATLINVSRGKVIDEKSLIQEIHSGKFLGVALDVFENEPLSNDSLWDFENVIVTPHNSFVSSMNRERLMNLIYTNLSKKIKNSED